MKVKIICQNCGLEGYKRKGDLTRAKKLGRKIYCSKECASEARRIYFNNPNEMKVCTVCEQAKKVNEFRLRKANGKDYRVAMCKPCEREISNSQVDQSKKREYERKRLLDDDFRKLKNKYQRYWRKNNIDKNRKYHSDWIKKQVDYLTDNYVKRHILSLNPEADVSIKSIQIKRAEILTKRLKKLIKNGKK